MKAGESCIEKKLKKDVMTEIERNFLKWKSFIFFFHFPQNWLG